MEITVDNAVVKQQNTEILHGVSLTARPGEVLGLIGPNGAGKSTLLAALAGDLAVESGSVRLGNHDPARTSSRELARVRSVMLQDVSVAFSFLVRDIVAMGRRPWAGTPRSEHDEELIDAALAATGVSHLAGRDIMTLSGGERARAALSRVLVQQTPIAFFDEPTASMDIRHQEQSLGLIRQLADSGATVVVVLHDLNATAAYCDHVVCLHQGAVAADGTVAEVFTEEILSAVYEWPISVRTTPEGVSVLPARGGGGAGPETALSRLLSRPDSQMARNS